MPTAAARVASPDLTQRRAWFAAVMVAAFLVVPRAAPVLAPGLAAILFHAVPSTTRDWRIAATPAPFIAIAAFVGWALASVGWAADPRDTLGKVVLLALFTATAWTVTRTLPSIPDAELSRITRAALIAFCAALAFLAIEEYGDHSIKRLLFQSVPWVRPSLKHVSVDVDSGEVVAIAGYVSNRSMAALTLSLWPMLLIGWNHLPPTRRLWGTLAVLAIAVLAMARSEHDTSVLAIVAAIIVFAATAWLPKRGLGLIAAGWLLATLAVVPLADWAFRTGELHHARWLPHTAQQRIILWGYTAQQVPKRLVLGVGADSTKPLDAQRGPRVETPAGFSYQWRTGPHAHNVFLQIWYELGLVGALLLCAAGLTVVRAIAGLDRRQQPAMAAALTAAAVTGAFTWGFWQPWFMAAFTLSGLLCLFAIELDARSGRGRS